MDRTMGIGANMGGIGMADEAKMEKLKMDKEEMKAMLDSMEETQMSSMMEMMGKMGKIQGDTINANPSRLAINILIISVCMGCSFFFKVYTMAGCLHSSTRKLKIRR